MSQEYLPKDTSKMGDFWHDKITVFMAAKSWTSAIVIPEHSDSHNSANIASQRLAMESQKIIHRRGNPGQFIEPRNGIAIRR